jgi:putative hydrolase of the HAD superfamily
MRSSEEIALIAELDARMWTVADPVLVAWQAQLYEAGVKTAILSNMGDMVRESVERSFSWVQNFDVRLWSYELRLLKPDPGIYRIALDRLGTNAEETLFLDDIEKNIEAARGIGVQSIHYKGIDALREELVRLGTSLPLPESVAR